MFLFPTGEWTLEHKEAERALVNRFQVEEVDTCLILWAPGVCNLELWSVERPVSKSTPIQIRHEYEIQQLTEQ